jgi:hypothetical protein
MAPHEASCIALKSSSERFDRGWTAAGCVAVLNGSDVDQGSLTLFNDFMGLPALVLGQNYDVVYPDGPPGIAPPIDTSGAEAYSEALLDCDVRRPVPMRAVIADGIVSRRPCATGQ